jgi:hypothetical protein
VEVACPAFNGFNEKVLNGDHGGGALGSVEVGKLDAARGDKVDRGLGDFREIIPDNGLNQGLGVSLLVFRRRRGRGGLGGVVLTAWRISWPRSWSCQS